MTPFFQKKIRKILSRKSEYIECQFPLPEPLDENDLKELVNELRGGNLEVMERIILGHLKLAAQIASKYVALAHTKRIKDDILQEAFLAVTQAVNWSAPPHNRLNDDSITPYIAATIHSFIDNIIKNDRTYGPPGRTVRDRFAKDNPLPQSHQAPILNVIDEANQLVEVIVDQGRIIGMSTEDSHVELEIKEILDKITFNFITKRILELREESFTYQEIGPQVGYSVSRVSQLMLEVESDFNKKYG